MTPKGSGHWGEGWVHIQEIGGGLGWEGGGGYGAPTGAVGHQRKGRGQRHPKGLWDT